MASILPEFVPIFVVTLSEVLGLVFLALAAVLALPFMLWAWRKDRARRERLAASMALVDRKFKKSPGSFTQGELYTDNSTGGRKGPGRE